MLRLSKKGWNNVLIFSMLIMIMVFNGMHKKFNFGEVEPQQLPLFGDDMLLLTLELPNVKIERVGQTWRANPATSLSNEQLATMVQQWYQLPLQVQLDDSEASVMTQGKMPNPFVVAYLAGKTDGAVYAFYPQADGVWIHDQQLKRWFMADTAALEQLLPQALLNPSHLSTAQ